MTTFLQTKLQWLSNKFDHNVVLCTFKDAIEMTEPTKNKKKQIRPVIKRFDHPNYIIKGEDDGRDYTYCDDDYNKLCSFWDGIILVDLDLKNDKTLSKDKDADRIRVELLKSLSELSPHNFCYIENSDSDLGKHLLFYFDCDRNFYNYKQCCCYVVDTMKQVIKEEYFDKSTDVFDWRALLVTQNIFLTTKNCYTIDADGAITFKYDDATADANWSNVIKEDTNVEIQIEGNAIIIESTPQDTDLEMHHSDRFVVFNTLKHYNVDINKALDITSKIYDLIGSKSKHNKNEWLSECKGVYKQNTKLTTNRGISMLSRLGFDIGNKTEATQNEIVFDLKGYISNYPNINEIIFENLNKNVRMNMTAPTGAGKTEFIKKFSNFLLNNNLNVVILTPQNITNTLYTNTRRTHHLRKGTPKARNRKANLIGTQSNNYEYKPDKMNIMIWDQLYKVVKEITTSNAVIIIDEAHKLVEDDYRYSAIPTLSFLNEYKGMELYITATEIKEMSEALGIKNTIEFKKERINNDIYFINTKDDKDAKKLLKKIIDRAIKKESPHIMLANDILFNDLAEYCFRHGEIPNIYRSPNNMTTLYETNPLNILTKTEQVDETSSISLMTNVCYQGINIKNEAEMVVIIPFFIGTTTAQQIEQIIGRKRIGKLYVYVVTCWQWSNEANEALKRLLSENENEIYNDIIKKFFAKKTKANAIYGLKERGFNIMTSSSSGYVYEVKDRPKRKKDIIHKYERTLYDYINDIEIDEENKNDFVDEIFNQEYEFNISNRHREIIEEAKKHFNENKYINGILDDTINWNIEKYFIDYVKQNEIGKYAHPHFVKLLKYLKGARKLQGSMRVDQIEEYIETCENKIKNTHFENISPKKAAAIKAQMFTTFEREFIIPAHIAMDGFTGVQNVYDILNGFIKGKSNGGAKGGAISSPKKCVEVTNLMKQSLREKYKLTIGQTFGSCDAMSKAINVNPNTISRWVKSGWLKQVECGCDN